MLLTTAEMVATDTIYLLNKNNNKKKTMYSLRQERNYQLLFLLKKKKLKTEVNMYIFFCFNYDNNLMIFMNLVGHLINYLFWTKPFSEMKWTFIRKLLSMNEDLWFRCHWKNFQLWFKDNKISLFFPIWGTCTSSVQKHNVANNQCYQMLISGNQQNCQNRRKITFQAFIWWGKWDSMNTNGILLWLFH